MGDVTCETCGVQTWSARHPCVNCETAPPVRDWSGSFQFNEALRGMRLGKRVRRHGWMAHVGIEDRGNGVPLMVIGDPASRKS